MRRKDTEMSALRAMLGGVAIASALSVAPNVARAVPITTSSDFTINLAYSPAIGVTAAADAVFSNFVFGANDSVTFNLDITNLSTGTSPGNDIRLVSFGWNTDPAASSATNTSSVYASTTNVSLTSTQVSVCLYGGSKCSGGSNGGLEDPQNSGLHGDPTTTGTFSTTIDFVKSVPPLDFSGFIGKFQTASYSSFDVNGCVAGADGCSVLSPPSQQGVPEPASFLLMGAGLLGLTAARRASRRRDA